MFISNAYIRESAVIAFYFAENITNGMTFLLEDHHQIFVPCDMEDFKKFSKDFEEYMNKEDSKHD